jgi:hypothetical protein
MKKTERSRCFLLERSVDHWLSPFQKPGAGHADRSRDAYRYPVVVSLAALRDEGQQDRKQLALGSFSGTDGVTLMLATGVTPSVHVSPSTFPPVSPRFPLSPFPPTATSHGLTP